MIYYRPTVRMSAARLNLGLGFLMEAVASIGKR